MSEVVERSMASSRPAEDQDVDRGTFHFRETSIADALCIAALLVAPLWVFGADSDRLGIYADDPSFFLGFPDLSPATLLAAVESYVTGRNLHVVWQYFIFALTGNTIEALPAQHRLEAFMVALNCASSYMVFRLVGLPILAGFLGAALFAFMPNHPEVYFWLTAFPQHLISTFLVLMLLISSIRTGWIARSGSRRRIGILLGVDLCIFVAGVFTYDQVALVMIAVFLGAAATCFALRADLRVMSALYAIAGVGIFILWATWKVTVPSFGPSMTNLSAFGLLRNFLFSLSLTAGPHFFRAFDQVLPSVFASSADRLSALAVAFSFLVVGLICLRGADGRAARAPDPNPPDRFVQWYPFILLTGIALFFLLAYLPAYLWYISFRHTYLPSVAVAGGVAWAIWRVGDMLARGSSPRLARAGMLAALLTACAAIYFSVGIVLAEKRDWIWSYQARKQMYADLVRDPGFKASSTLILVDFPNSVRPLSAPLGYQVPGEPAVMTRGQAHFANLVQISVPSRSGAFIYVDAERDGSDAFLHVSEATIYRVYFKGLEKDRILYSRDDGRTKQSDYTLEDAPAGNLSDQAGFRARRVAGRPAAIEVSIPSITLESSEVLAASPLLRTDSGMQRATTVTSGAARRLVLVDLSGDESGAARRLTVVFDDQVGRVAKMQIYAVSERGRRLIADLDVSDN
jgi:hypothetical protein